METTNGKTTTELLLEIINSILTNKGDSTLDSLSDEMRLREEIGLDSFDMAELTVKIEEDFDVDVFEDGLVFTIGEIKEKLQ